MKYNIYISTHEGNVRKNNEDNYCINDSVRAIENQQLNLRGYNVPEPVVCSVFDGMGGEANGEIASKISADEAVSLYKKCKKTGILIAEDIDIFVQTANDKIIDMAMHKKAKRSGSTFATVYIDDTKVYTYSLGDSRIYLYRDPKLIRITKDHTLAMKKYEANIYTKEEAERSPDSHKLTAFIGVDNDNQGLKAEKYDSFIFKKGDKLLICSDGLYDMCDDDTISEILSKKSKTISYDLIDMALNNGGIDNVTCIVIEASDT